MSYYNVLSAAKTTLDGVTALSTFQKKIRPAPAYLQASDTLPLCLVCPERGTWEQIEDLHYPDSVTILYVVTIALVYESTFDTTQLQAILAARDAIRKALWKPTGITGSVASIYDVDYNPSPGSVDLAALAPQLAVSLQQFTYKSNEARV
jgi:hypothetical protein